MLPQGNYALAQFAECPDCFRNAKRVLYEKGRVMNLTFFSIARGAWPEHSKLCLHFKVGTTPWFTSLNSHLIAPSSTRASLYSYRIPPGLPPNTLIKLFSCYEVWSKRCHGLDGLALALEELKPQQAVLIFLGAFLRGPQTFLVSIVRLLAWSPMIP